MVLCIQDEKEDSFFVYLNRNYFYYSIDDEVYPGQNAQNGCIKGKQLPSIGNFY